MISRKLAATLVGFAILYVMLMWLFKVISSDPAWVEYVVLLTFAFAFWRLWDHVEDWLNV